MNISSMWRSLLLAHNFSPHPICCKNILSEMSAAGGHFCLHPTKSNCGNKVAPCSLGLHPYPPALWGGNRDSLLALTFHSSCHSFAFINEIKHGMGTEVEHMLMTPRMLHALAWFAFPVTHRKSWTCSLMPVRFQMLWKEQDLFQCSYIVSCRWSSAVWTWGKFLDAMILSGCGTSLLLSSGQKVKVKS